MENIDLMIGEIVLKMDSISLAFAAEMAKSLKRGGLAMSLAIYRAAKYYNVSQREVAIEVKKITHHSEKPNHVAHSPSRRFGETGKEQAFWWDKQ